MRTIAILALLHLSASASAQTLTAWNVPPRTHDRSTVRARMVAPLPHGVQDASQADPAAALVMVFDAEGRNILSLGAGELTGFDVHQLSSGTFHLLTLNEAGEFLRRDQLVISRP